MQPRIELLELRRLLAVFSVTSASDSGAGSLRQALLDANAAPLADVIVFQVGSGLQTISLASALPSITDPVTIDGTTQPGYFGTPLIEINGAGAEIDATGLVIESGGTTVRGLIINRFGFDGVRLAGAGGNTIQNCWIGLASSGAAAAANAGMGMYITGSSNNAISGNVISGNGIDGIFVEQSSGNAIAGNTIGLASSGSAGVGNAGNGIVLGAGAQGNTIGGTTAAARNIISANGGDGVEILGDGASNNLVLGNYIGTRADGTTAQGNGGNGIKIDSSGASGVTNNTIGGTATGARNVIAANAGDGIQIAQGGGNTVQGNHIGVDAAGSLARGNANGVNIANSADNLIGGTTPAARNLVSGNRLNGIEIQNSNGTGNLVQGNFVGTNAAGTSAIANLDDGIDINSASSNTIGGTASGAGNLISGNGSDGVEIAADSSRFPGDAALNLVQGNLIGTNLSGAGAIANQGNGVRILDVTGITHASDNTIGGTTAAARNVISGNAGSGVQISGVNADENLVQGNDIGIAADGTSPLGNLGDGVSLGDTLAPVNGNVIGGMAPGAANRIAFNAGTGVVVRGGSGNSIRRNSIHSNGELGIDLGENAVTPNDPGDSDGGPNDLQNFPVISTASTTQVSGTLSSTPGASFVIELFSSPSADPSGYGEGSVFLAEVVVTTDAAGAASFNVMLPSALPGGNFVTATATAVAAGASTSEFSAAVQAGGVSLTTVSTAGFEHDATQPQVRFQFSAAISGASLDASDLLLMNLTTSTTVPTAHIAASAADPTIATFAFPGYPNGVLPDGDYRATLVGAGITDSNGQAVDGDNNGAPGGDFVLDFFVLGGDASRDRVVDITDLGILATNWQQAPRKFSQGDFNYDGVVDITDLGVLATNWQKSLAAQVSQPGFGTAWPASPGHRAVTAAPVHLRRWLLEVGEMTTR